MTRNVILSTFYFSNLHRLKHNATHIEALENRLRNIGPSSRADSAVAGYVRDGTFFLLHSTYSERTRIRMQYIQRNPMINVAIMPITYPALKNAFGIARIPVPKLPFSRWSMVSALLKNHREKRRKEIEQLPNN